MQLVKQKIFKNSSEDIFIIDIYKQEPSIDIDEFDNAMQDICVADFIERESNND